MHKSFRTRIFAILLLGCLLFVTGCSASPVGTVKSFMKSILKGELEKAGKMIESPIISAAFVQQQFQYPGLTTSDINQAMSFFTFAQTTNNGDSATVRMNVDFKGMMALSGENESDVNLEFFGMSLDDIFDMVSVWDFDMKKTKGKWKIAMINFPNAMKYADKFGGAGFGPGSDVMRGGRTW